MNTTITQKIFFNLLLALCVIYFFFNSLWSDKFIRNTIAFGLSVIIAFVAVDFLLSVHEYEQVQHDQRIQANK